MNESPLMDLFETILKTELLMKTRYTELKAIIMDEKMKKDIMSIIEDEKRHEKIAREMLGIL